MDISYTYYIASGFFIGVVFFLLSRCYKIFKVYSKFPTLYLYPALFNYSVLRKVPKDIPLNHYGFQYLISKCQQFIEEGLALTYILRPSLIIFGEEPVKVLVNEKAATVKPREYGFVEKIFGNGLVTSNGERWKKHRKMLNPSFQLGMLKERVPLFNEYASALVKDLETMANGQTVDPLNSIKYHYFRALSESIFGLKQSEENTAANLNYIHMIDSLSLIGLYIYAHPWLQFSIFRFISPSLRKFLQLKDDLFTFTKNVITEMEKLISADEIQNSEYFSKNMQKSLTYILLQHHRNDPSFTFEDMHAEVTTFMAAGYDTVSYTTMWCLYMLGLYPEVQEKAFNEVNSSSQDYISYEESCNFTYLEAVIMETLRLYPTIPVFGRETTEDVHFGKHYVPKKSHIIFLSYLLHRNPNIHPDPEKFVPERFLNGGLKNPLAHIPFAEGTRTCIGKKYALIELKIFLAHILRKFTFTSLDRREDIQLCYNIVLTPLKPLRMRITPRSSN